MMNAEITQIQPDLIIQNSVDEDGDTITYEFELYSDEEITVLVASEHNVSEGTGTTSWSASTDLNDNTRHFWRVRATDADDYSLWAYGSFFVNTENDPPGGFNNSSPRDNIEVDTQTPSLQVTNSVDIDEDPVPCTFEIYADSSMSALVAFASGIQEGESGSTSWIVDTTLDDNTRYYWRVVATDEHGALSETPLVSFLVNTLNAAPVSPLTPTVKNPGEKAWVETLAPSLLINPAGDPDNDGLIYRFELYSDDALTSMVTQGESPAVEWLVSSGLENNTRYYWRAQAEDEHGMAGVWMNIAYFFVSAGNAPPLNIEVRVETDKARKLSDLMVYAFTESGSYTGRNAITDGNGTALFVTEDFEDGGYKFRIDYLGQRFRSDPVSVPGVSTVDVVVAEETAEVTLSTAGGPAQGIRVYLFSETGSYLDIYEVTDENGLVSFDLPAGCNFKFRADILGNRYWSEITTETTDASGRAEFVLPDRSYKFRADEGGAQSWSEVINITAGQANSVELDFD